jgi:hypothetical protein
MIGMKSEVLMAIAQMDRWTDGQMDRLTMVLPRSDFCDSILLWLSAKYF